MIPDYHLSDMLPQSKLQIVADATSTITAAGAVSAPLWFPVLKGASEVAAALLPFLGIILIVLQIIVYGRRIQTGGRTHKHAGGLSSNAVMWWLVALVTVLGMLMLVHLSAAHAHDHEHPELNQWYHDLHSSAGTWCCEGEEATHLADEDWETKDGHYLVRLNGQWVEVPDGAVIHSPNRDGRTLVWPIFVSGIAPSVRCFLPGSMT